MSAAALESALAGAGILAAVEGRDRLALIVVASEADSRSIAVRRSWVVSTAAAHGFSHVALEIAGGGGRELRGWGDAALPGD